MIPYFIMIVWTITVTVCVARNTTAINTDTREKTMNVCVSDNHLKSIIDTVIIKNAEFSSSKEKIIWIKLDKKLYSQLTPANCRN